MCDLDIEHEADGAAPDPYQPARHDALSCSAQVLEAYESGVEARGGVA